MSKFTSLELLGLSSDSVCRDCCRCVSVGTRKGYTILNCEPFGKVHTKSELRITHILRPRAPVAHTLTDLHLTAVFGVV